jgi:protein-disulfide isomerase
VALASGVFVGYSLGTPKKQTEQAAPAVAQAPAALGEVKRYKIPVSSSQPSLGPADALVTLVQWCDFPDPACAAQEPVIQAVMSRNEGLVRLLFRHYGRPDNPGSALAHQFLAASHTHGGKFWEARKLLFAHRGELTRQHVERYAGMLGLNWPSITKAIDDHEFATVITADRLFAGMFDVTEVPALFVNGRPVKAPVTQASLEALVQEELKHGVQLVAGGVPKTEVYAELTKKGVWTPVKREMLQ